MNGPIICIVLFLFQKTSGEIGDILEFHDDPRSPHRSSDDLDIDFNFRSSCDK